MTIAAHFTDLFPRPESRRATFPTLNVAWITLGALSLAGLYAVGALLPFWFLKSPEAGAAFFPPAGITISALLLTERRLWPIWLAVIAATELVVDVTHRQSVAMGAGFALANTVEPLVGAIALIYLARRRSTFRSLLTAALLAAVALGPLVGAAIGATIATVLGNASDWVSVFGKWWLGDALGVLVLAPAILGWARRSKYDQRCSLLEIAAMAVLALVITVVPGVLWDHPMLYAVLPVLVWAALRGGWQAVGIAGVAVAFGTDWVAVTGRAGDLIISGPSGTQLVFIQIFLGVTILAGLTLAVEVADRERAEATLRSAQAEQNRIELEFTTAALHERQRIARDTHDIVGHALNVMLLQTAAARRAAPADSGNTTKLLQSVESVGRQALQELEVALGLADPEPAMLATKGLSHVPHLVETMRRAGMNVELDIDGNSHIPALVDRSAYRIIEEAMTNVAKHAPTASTQITIRFEPDRLVVSVRDDGAMTPPARVSGHGRGLAGMRERVAMLGGALTAGRLPDKGFAVEAVIPYRAVT